MNRPAWLGVLLVLAGPVAHAPAIDLSMGMLVSRLPQPHLAGRVMEHTNWHGADRRIWSSALCQQRCLYVYLPPGFDPCTQYPLVVWLHGLIEDARCPVANILPYFDRAITSGKMPPVIVALPDGHFPGSLADSHFLNTRAGRYEDYLVQDVLPFIAAHYPVRPEGQAHAIMGFSMSGWAAYSVALKNPDDFGVVIGILPLLNLRWVDCHGNYRSHFDPCCWGWRTELCKNTIIGRLGPIPATLREVVEPYFGWGPDGLAWLTAENPIDLLDRCAIQPGHPVMYVAYIRTDELHVDAQVESFLCAARQQGLCVTVDYYPYFAQHSTPRARKFLPCALEWLGTQFAPACGPEPGHREAPEGANP